MERSNIKTEQRQIKEIQWFLLRGLAREVRHWGSFPEVLRKPYISVNCLELPGLGKRYQETSPYQISDYVKDLRMSYLKIKSNGEKGICAISMGGMIAQEWMASYPQDFQYGVIINSSGGNLSRFYERLSPSTFKMITQLFLEKDQLKVARKILEQTTELVTINHDLVAKWAYFAREYPLARFNFIRQLNAARSFVVPKKIQSPLLFLASKKDKLAKISCSEKLAQHYQAELAIHETAGHDLPLDDPQWVVNRIVDFVSENR